MIESAAPAPPTDAVATALVRLGGRPFGLDEDGTPIRHGSGKVIVGAIRYMQEVVGRRAARGASPTAGDQERDDLVAAAQSAALDRLVEMLNAAIVDERFRVSRDYLLDESNNYSYEFRLFVAEYCRVISGDPDFFFNQGTRSIPSVLVHLVRPLGLQRIYGVLPRMTAKFVQTDLRVVRTTPSSAIVRWYGASQIERIPAQHRTAYTRYACRVYQGVFAAIPSAVYGLPFAAVRESRCQTDGAEYCEWELSWQQAGRQGLSRWLGVWVAVATLLLAGLLLGFPGTSWVAWTAPPLALALAWSSNRSARLGTERRRLEGLLLEQRDLSEAEYDRGEQAKAELQVANLELQQRVSELTVLHEVALALSATLDLEELLDASLRAVVAHLRVERALVLLVDEERGVLGRGHSVGGSPEMTALVAEVEIDLERDAALLVRVLGADRPLLFTDVDQNPDERNRELALALGVRSFLGTPLVTKGRKLGVLVVDNGLTGRPLSTEDGPLLFTVGNEIASAVEGAQLYQQLERRVQERTAALARASAEAEEARAAAEQANRAKSAFLAHMSHELRTPLNAIIGYSEMLQEEAEDEGLDALLPDLRKIQGAGKHLLNLISNVLDLSKIEAERMDLFVEAVDLDALVRGVVDTIRPLAEQRGNEVAVSAPDLGVVPTDETKLRQVLLNVLGNACKFTERGRIEFAVARTGGDGDPERIVFRVADSGIGMTPEQIAGIFEPFAQAGAATARTYGGTGLGLAISRRFCRMMGGDIAVESAPGQGSTFTITLPISGDAAPAEPGPAPTAQRLAPERRPTILVIDDEDAVRDLLRRVLEKAGFDVVGAADGEEGVRLARTIAPDVITLDVVMPGQDGWAVLGALKADPALAAIPVVMVTIVDERSRGFALGATDYLTKPVDRERLAAVLRGVAPRATPRVALLVDDDPDARSALRPALERDGWDVAEAVDGWAALDWLRSHRPGLILLDLLMPNMNGFEFLAEVRTRQEWRGLPVVVITAKDLTPDDRRRLDGQVAQVLGKHADDLDGTLAEIRAAIAARAHDASVALGAGTPRHG